MRRFIIVAFALIFVFATTGVLTLADEEGSDVVSDSTDADVIVKPKAFTEGPLEDEGDWFYPTDNGNGRVTVKIDPIHVGG